MVACYLLALSLALVSCARPHSAPWELANDLDLHFQTEVTPSDDRPGPRARFVGTHFAMHKNIAHGEREIRVFYSGVVAMETVVMTYGENELFFREVTDGKKVVTLVYKSSDVLSDCDVSRDRGDVDKFLARFLDTEVSEVEALRRSDRRLDIGDLVGMENAFSGSKVSFQILENRALLEPYAHMVDIRDLKAQCVAMHHELRRLIHEQGRQTTEVAEGDRVKRGAEEVRRRSKRSMLLYPGTLWCGRGSEARSYDELGEEANTDRCCREHDGCDHYIAGFENKYSYFNYRFNTISHCYCDETFRTCLKSAGSEIAEMVGNVYFNVLGMTCFEFRAARVCSKRSWWGRCIKYSVEHQARVMGTLTWD